jgi:hypothetical protein
MTNSVPVDNAEVEALLKAADFHPDAGQMAAIVDAYGHVRVMLDRLKTDYGFGDEPAHVFDPLRF